MKLGQKLTLIIALTSIPVVLILALLITLTCFLCIEKLGFTLVIKGTPSATQVFVNEMEFPAPQEKGEIKLQYLKSGVAHSIRLSHSDYEDFVFITTGVEGEVKEFTAELVPVPDCILE